MHVRVRASAQTFVMRVKCQPGEVRTHKGLVIFACIFRTLFQRAIPGKYFVKSGPFETAAPG